MWPREAGDPFGVFVANIGRSLERRGFEVRESAVIRGRKKGLRDKTLAHLSLGADIARSTLAPADCVYVHAPTWFGPLVELARRPRGKRLVIHAHGEEVFPSSRVGHASKLAIARSI